ncbi:DUF3247 family protein [Xanthomonas massiliensis]|jgi:hypothetical protein|uniref:DUF3247 family protein n=1 Tax=Xanthomonas massiliensis TaxID=1720302 RepID=UPI0008241CA5|nr:DUF3247 family protein [Xanthomonas massiliensis]
MTQYAPRVQTEQARIEAMEALLPLLREGARVEVVQTDGSRVLGVVPVQPTLQMFRDADEHEGSNGLLRLDDLDEPAIQHHVWLDAIEEVRVLPSRP